MVPSILLFLQSVVVPRDSYLELARTKPQVDGMYEPDKDQSMDGLLIFTISITSSDNGVCMV